MSKDGWRAGANSWADGEGVLGAGIENVFEAGEAIDDCGGVEGVVRSCVESIWEQYDAGDRIGDCAVVDGVSGAGYGTCDRRKLLSLYSANCSCSNATFSAEFPSVPSHASLAFCLE